MAVPRKAMTEGIRISLFPGTPCECNLTIPQSKIKDFCQLPLHKGAFGCSCTSAIDESPAGEESRPGEFSCNLAHGVLFCLRCYQ